MYLPGDSLFEDQRIVINIKTYRDNLYRRLIAEDIQRDGSVSGLQISVASGVFNPWAATSSFMLASAVEAERPRTAIDVGTGCGVQALLVAANGAKVWATDIQSAALDCARRNARDNGLADRIIFLNGDCYAGCAEKVDLVICNPPFICETPRDDVEKAICDPGHALLHTLLHGIADRLTPEGLGGHSKAAINVHLKTGH